MMGFSKPNKHYSQGCYTHDLENCHFDDHPQTSYRIQVFYNPKTKNAIISGSLEIFTKARKEAKKETYKKRIKRNLPSHSYRYASHCRKCAMQYRNERRKRDLPPHFFRYDTHCRQCCNMYANIRNHSITALSEKALSRGITIREPEILS